MRADAEASASTPILRVADVSLFCAWETPSALSTQGSEHAALSTSLPSAATITGGSAEGMAANRRIELRADPLLLTRWEAKRVLAIPVDGSDELTLDELQATLVRLFRGAQRISPLGSPLYFVLHIGQVTHASQPRSAWDRRGGGGGLAGHPRLSPSGLRALLDVVSEARALAGVRGVGQFDQADVESSDVASRDAAYFEHYSPLRRRRGYLILDPLCSIVIDGAEEEARLLLSMAQTAAIRADGLTPASYQQTLLRVSAWDANGDVQESLNDLVHLDRSGRAATTGGVLLSIALAGFSTLLALTQLQTVDPHRLIIPISLYALASLLYALYAVSGWRPLHWGGVLALLAATGVSAFELLAPSTLDSLASLFTRR
jgi:hypothetical protein